MKCEDLFQLRSSLVESGFSEINAEKAVSALENGMADRIDDVMTKSDKRLDAVMEKWDSHFDAVMEKWEHRFTSEFALVRRDIELLRRDMTIRLGAMIALAVGVIATLIKLF